MTKRGPKPLKQRKRYRAYYEKTEVVNPTAELVAKRVARFVIAGVKAENAELRLAESWLGVLFAAQVITREQYDAGENYHRLYKAMFPQGFCGSCMDPDAPEMNGVRFQQYESNALDKMDLAWRTTEKVLAAIDKRAHSLVKNICVFGRFERFIDTSSPRPKEAWRADAQDRTRFICGLDALAMAYGYKAAPKEMRLAA